MERKFIQVCCIFKRELIIILFHFIYVYTYNFLFNDLFSSGLFVSCVCFKCVFICEYICVFVCVCTVAFFPMWNFAECRNILQSNCYLKFYIIFSLHWMITTRKTWEILSVHLNWDSKSLNLVVLYLCTVLLWLKYVSLYLYKENLICVLRFI